MNGASILIDHSGDVGMRFLFDDVGRLCLCRRLHLVAWTVGVGYCMGGIGFGVVEDPEDVIGGVEGRSAYAVV